MRAAMGYFITIHSRSKLPGNYMRPFSKYCIKKGWCFIILCAFFCSVPILRCVHTGTVFSTTTVVFTIYKYLAVS